MYHETNMYQTEPDNTSWVPELAKEIRDEHLHKAVFSPGVCDICTLLAEIDRLKEVSTLNHSVR